MNFKKVIVFIIIIIIILLAIFLSQQVYSRAVEKTLISAAKNQASAYVKEATNWAMSDIYPKISGEVQKRGSAIQNDINQEKQKVSENIGTQIKNYFSGIANSIVHPGQNNSCAPQPPSTSTQTSN